MTFEEFVVLWPNYSMRVSVFHGQGFTFRVRGGKGDLLSVAHRVDVLGNRFRHVVGTDIPDVLEFINDIYNGEPLVVGSRAVRTDRENLVCVVHKWSHWSKPLKQVKRGVASLSGITELRQYRHCVNCNIIESRNVSYTELEGDVPEWLQAEEMPADMDVSDKESNNTSPILPMPSPEKIG